MNGKTLLASLAIGLTLGVAGCKCKPNPARTVICATSITDCNAHIAAPFRKKLASARGAGETVDASTIDRALTRAEIYSRYSKETAAEFYANGYDR